MMKVNEAALWNTASSRSAWVTYWSSVLKRKKGRRDTERERGRGRGKGWGPQRQRDKVWKNDNEWSSRSLLLQLIITKYLRNTKKAISNKFYRALRKQKYWPFLGPEIVMPKSDKHIIGKGTTAQLFSWTLLNVSKM